MFFCKRIFKAAKSFDLPGRKDNINAAKRQTGGGGGGGANGNGKQSHTFDHRTDDDDNHIYHHSFRRRNSTDDDPPPNKPTAYNNGNTNKAVATPDDIRQPNASTSSGSNGTATPSTSNPSQKTVTLSEHNVPQIHTTDADDPNSQSDSDLSSEPTPIDLNPPTPQINERKEGVISETAIGDVATITAIRNGSGVGNRGSLDLTVHSFNKTTGEEEVIRRAIGANDFLNNMMDAERMRIVVGAMRLRTYAPGSRIIEEGEQGDHFYIAEQGEFEVLKAGVVKGSFGPGVVFGELAILYKAKRFASIRTIGEARVWMLERQVFQKIMISTGCQEREQNIAFLSSVPVLKDVAQDVLDKMVDLLKREFYVTGSTIICQGDPGDKFYIIRGGRAKVVKRNSLTGESMVVGFLKRGDYFGEHALIHQDKRLASIISQGPGTECLTLDRIAFNKYLGVISELKNANRIGAYITTAAVRAAVRMSPAYEHLVLDDLNVVGTLGIGGFGRVELVQYPRTSETFALKILKKHDIVSQGQVQHAYCEKEIMAMCECSFIVKLYKTFRNKKYIYFLMEPCLGGDVWTQLQQHKHFSEPIAQFVTGCVIEALEYLHSRNIIYRDLKPENLMVDGQGFVKMVDFGFAKILQPTEKTWTFSGTPEYVAPEIILNKGHDRAVDYWALGVLIHELLVGKPPFRGKDHMRTYNAILRGIDAVRMSPRIPKAAQHLIRDLCRQIPTDRVGYQKKGIAEIKSHSWFAGGKFNWHALRARTIDAPLKQPIKSGVDMSNFEEFPPEREEPPDETSGWDLHF